MTGGDIEHAVPPPPPSMVLEPPKPEVKAATRVSGGPATPRKGPPRFKQRQTRQFKSKPPKKGVQGHHCHLPLGGLQPPGAARAGPVRHHLNPPSSHHPLYRLDPPPNQLPPPWPWAPVGPFILTPYHTNIQ
uniref:Retinal rod rhodopsin-sensitive cGMP 3',5'-cyclic phosphodiesterase subunit gamma n=1 Tax=Pygocentrus nattereri TaxID=42514 RepID=A0AAR2K7B7_PYGNA